MTTSTVFGDFLREASEQMETAVYCAERATITGSPAIATLKPAQHMTTVLLRHLDRLSADRNPVHQRVSHLWDRVNHPRVLLQEADLILRELGQQTEGRGRRNAHAVTAHVAAAALAMGTGHDLLQTHYAPRSDWANAIEHADVRHALLEVVARQAQLLGKVMSGLRKELRKAGLPIVKLERLVNALHTSGDIAFRVTAPGAVETLAAIPLRTVPTPAPLPVTSSIDQICAGITADSEGIRAAASRRQDAIPVVTCQRNATAGVVVLHCAHQAVVMLMRRHIELHPANELLLRRRLRESAEGLDRLLARWLNVRQTWKRLIIDRQQPPASPHLDQLTIRMGRLISTNPEWIPGLPGSPPMKTPAELTPTTAEMPQLLLSVRHAVEAVAVLASHDLAHVVESGLDQIMCALHRKGASPYGQAGPAAVHPLVVAFREVIGYSNAALSHLDQTTLDTATPTQRPGVMVALSILDRAATRPSSPRCSMRLRLQALVGQGRASPAMPPSRPPLADQLPVDQLRGPPSIPFSKAESQRGKDDRALVKHNPVPRP